MRLHRLALPVLAAPVLALAACGQQSAEPTGAASSLASDAPATVANGPAAPAGLVISDATVNLPAVSGNPGVAYFTLSQTGGPAQKIVAVHVDGFERAELHESRSEGGVSSMGQVQSVDVTPDKPATFAPGGLHVMLFDAKALPKPGSTVELTVTLDNGDKISAPAQVQGAGGGAMDMGGMDHMDHMDHM